MMMSVLNRMDSLISSPSIPVTAPALGSSIRGKVFLLADWILMKFRDEPESISVFAGSMIPSIVVYQIAVLFAAFSLYTYFLEGFGAASDMDAGCRSSFPTH